MNQQINLYQPIFREERKLFSLRTVLVGLGIVSVSLLAMWALGARNIANLEKSVAQLRTQQAAQEALAQSAGALLGGQGSATAMQAQVAALSAQLAERTRALALLRAGAAGEPKGFAARLSALARQTTPGLWLDEVTLASGTHGLALHGRSVDADIIPKYLQQLTTEPELSGARFDSVVIDRRKHHETEVVPAAEQDEEDPRSVRFSVSSATMQSLAGKAALNSTAR